MPKSMNNPMLRSMKKRKKEREQDSPYFQIKGNHQKRERAMYKKVYNFRKK
jgi:hypothetical protein